MNGGAKAGRETATRCDCQPEALGNEMPIECQMESDTCEDHRAEWSSSPLLARYAINSSLAALQSE